MSDKPQFEPISADLRHAISDLVAHGLVRHNGEYRPNAAGVLRPVYTVVPDEALTDHARAYKEWLERGEIGPPP